ncbi:hypothetical protein K501DRAFT_54644 [Backusella circina FSU 941]|nr:hypothetical protein K501DRAFT_54644 [Backusella circina FSU 941]
MSTFIKTVPTNTLSGSELEKRRRLSIEEEDNIELQYAKKRAGRKAIEEDSENYRQSSDDPTNKRKAQNRAAQKAFRERKLNHIRVLEQKIQVLQKKEDEKNLELLSENEKLKQIVEQLENEKSLLLGASMSIDYIQQQHHVEPYHRQEDILPHTFDVNNIQLNQHELQIDKIMAAHHEMTEEEEVVAHSNNNIKRGNCPTPEDIAKAWDILYKHPRFDEFDHKLLCGAIRQKMKSDDLDHFKAVERVVEEHYPVHDFLK